MWKQSFQKKCFTKKEFWKFFKNYLENTCAGDLFFNKITNQQHATLLKRKLQHKHFTLRFSKLFRTDEHLLATVSATASWIYIFMTVREFQELFQIISGKIMWLTHWVINSWRRSLSNRNQSTDLQSKFISQGLIIKELTSQQSLWNRNHRVSN